MMSHNQATSSEITTTTTNERGKRMHEISHLTNSVAWLIFWLCNNILINDYFAYLVQGDQITTNTHTHTYMYIYTPSHPHTHIHRKCKQGGKQKGNLITNKLSWVRGAGKRLSCVKGHRRPPTHPHIHTGTQKCRPHSIQKSVGCSSVAALRVGAAGASAAWGRWDAGAFNVVLVVRVCVWEKSMGAMGLGLSL